MNNLLNKPESPYCIGIIGCGRYGGAIARGFNAAQTSHQLWLYDQVADCSASLAVETQAHLADTLEALQQKCNVLIIAVSDANAPEVLSQLNQLSTTAWIVSISSGLLHQEAAALWSGGVFIRALPNILTRFAHGQMAVSYSEKHPLEPQRQVIHEVFGAIAQIFEMPEAHIPIFRATAGIAPAFISTLLQVAQTASKEAFEQADQALINDYWLTAALASLQVIQSQQVSVGILARLGMNPGGATETFLHEFEHHQIAINLSKSIQAGLNAAKHKEKLSSEASEGEL